MSELTDLEICKRIAEIEHPNHTIYCDVGNSLTIRTPRLIDFNPLADDALCFRLMVKYKIILIPVNENYGTGPLVGYNAFYKQLTDKIHLEELNPNKAILLAIIEANNED